MHCTGTDPLLAIALAVTLKDVRERLALARLFRPQVTHYLPCVIEHEARLDESCADKFFTKFV